MRKKGGGGREGIKKGEERGREPKESETKGARRREERRDEKGKSRTKSEREEKRKKGVTDDDKRERNKGRLSRLTRGNPCPLQQ